MAITAVERKLMFVAAAAICAGWRRNKLSTPFVRHDGSNGRPQISDSIVGVIRS
jgi:hypothetical protein